MNTKVRARRISRQKHRSSTWIPIAVGLVIIILLVAGMAAYITAPPTVAGSSKYLPEEVAHEQPFLAIHDMGEGPSIPFLASDQAQPDIQVPIQSFDFGTIGPLDKVEQEFIIRNVGEAPLTVSRAYTTCGCTTAAFSARVIQPGQVATITLIFDAGFHETAGQTVRRGLIIENNDPRQSQTEIWIQAKVRAN